MIQYSQKGRVGRRESNSGANTEKTAHRYRTGTRYFSSSDQCLSRGSIGLTTRSRFQSAAGEDERLCTLLCKVLDISKTLL